MSCVGGMVLWVNARARREARDCNKVKNGLCRVCVCAVAVSIPMSCLSSPARLSRHPSIPFATHIAPCSRIIYAPSSSTPSLYLPTYNHIVIVVRARPINTLSPISAVRPFAHTHRHFTTPLPYAPCHHHHPQTTSPHLSMPSYRMHARALLAYTNTTHTHTCDACVCVCVLADARFPIFAILWGAKMRRCAEWWCVRVVCLRGSL